MTNQDTIRLEFFEVLMAAQVGVARHVSALRANRKDRYRWDNNVWARHIEGACAELAFAKWAGLYWSGSVDTFQAPGRDVNGIEIRVTTHQTGDRPPNVLVRPIDPDGLVVVGVLGAAPEYTMFGWTHARVAKQKGRKMQTGGGPEYYLLSAGDCNGMKDLRALITRGRLECQGAV